ncbi:hypothetical protein L9F63_021780, partial [Diploptera punctata]
KNMLTVLAIVHDKEKKYVNSSRSRSRKKISIVHDKLMSFLAIMHDKLMSCPERFLGKNMLQFLAIVHDKFSEKNMLTVLGKNMLTVLVIVLDKLMFVLSDEKNMLTFSVQLLQFHVSPNFSPWHENHSARSLKSVLSEFCFSS